MSGYKSIDRREFIQNVSKSAAAIAVASLLPISIYGENRHKRLIILHTNDVHSRIEPFPMDGGKFQGRGGFSARNTIIEKIRSIEKNVLLLDAGDILQGTPYFNYFHGDLEFELMSAMKYDAAAIGNHDFDGGMENLARLADKATFPLICSNYDFKETILENKIAEYKIIEKDDIRIGIYALGIELNGLVPDNLCSGIKYSDPVTTALRFEQLLKTKKCDFIICLSHLGYSYSDNKVSDQIIAHKTNFTDVILGGHTHTFMSKPEEILNNRQKSCYIFQTGWGGVNLGRLDFEFDAGKNKKMGVANSLSVS